MKTILAFPLFIFLVGCMPTQQTELNFANTVNGPNENASSNDSPSNYSLSSQVTDRKFTYSVLKQVFNVADSSPEDTHIKSNILQKIEFGGACDPYAPSDMGNASIEFQDEQCFNGIGHVQASNSNPMRFSLTSKVCEYLLSRPNSLAVVRNKILNSTSWSTPTEVSVKKAWSLFYPNDNIDAATTKALVDISLATSTDEEAWKGIIFTLCSSPAWQVI